MLISISPLIYFAIMELPNLFFLLKHPNYFSFFKQRFDLTQLSFNTSPTTHGTLELSADSLNGIVTSATSSSKQQESGEPQSKWEVDYNNLKMYDVGSYVSIGYDFLVSLIRPIFSCHTSFHNSLCVKKIGF